MLFDKVILYKNINRTRLFKNHKRNGLRERCRAVYGENLARERSNTLRFCRECNKAFDKNAGEDSWKHSRVAFTMLARKAQEKPKIEKQGLIIYQINTKKLNAVISLKSSNRLTPRGNLLIIDWHCYIIITIVKK